MVSGSLKTLFAKLDPAKTGHPVVAAPAGGWGQATGGIAADDRCFMTDCGRPGGIAIPASPISSVSRSRQQGREAEPGYRMPPQRPRRMG